jgi:hypothetical protein
VLEAGCCWAAFFGQWFILDDFVLHNGNIHNLLLVLALPGCSGWLLGQEGEVPGCSGGIAAAEGTASDIVASADAGADVLEGDLAWNAGVNCLRNGDESEREMCLWAISKYFGDLVTNTSALM